VAIIYLTFKAQLTIILNNKHCFIRVDGHETLCQEKI
jgi:hypothetical protein